jgi:hypothetical protein
MSESDFERLIRENEPDLVRIRDFYFPMIKDGVITGYNLYSKNFDYSEAHYFLNYLHSGLKPGNRHLEELVAKLKEELNLDLKAKTTIKDRIIGRSRFLSRDSTYALEPDWENPSNMRFFTYEGKEITLEEAKVLGGPLIGESLQYDLLIKISDVRELRSLLNLFKLYTSKIKLDERGNKILDNGVEVQNNEAITDAWAVPLITCTSLLPINFEDLVLANEFNVDEVIRGNKVRVSTLSRVGNNNLISKLINGKKTFRVDEKQTLRVFMEGYTDKKIK